MDEITRSMKARSAFVFPGQGSQYVGMGKQLYHNFDSARHIFDRADDVLGYPISKLCFEGSKEELDDTYNAQPAILTVSIACLEAMKEYCEQMIGGGVVPMMVAGHSLGEFTALIAAGVLDFDDGLLLVRERGRLMKESGQQQPGGMAAIIGLDHEALQQVCIEAQTEGIVTLANDNSPGQTVLSGEIAALQRAMELAKARGAKIVKQLAITVASHSPLMQQTALHFAETVRNFCLHPPQVPLLSNITAQAITSVDDLRQELVEQLVHPVQWTRSIQTAVGAGVETFVEIGPGQVLSGLIRRITQNVPIISINDSEIVKLLAGQQNPIIPISTEATVSNEATVSTETKELVHE